MGEWGLGRDERREEGMKRKETNELMSLLSTLRLIESKQRRRIGVSTVPEHAREVQRTRLSSSRTSSSSTNAPRLVSNHERRIERTHKLCNAITALIRLLR